ncbi:MAG: hypothetical protein C4527_07900 [Candidatus Omnitrophota bacterium]|nr:MAG: hypothetical protein C4527_07900 [Candidatus Omnitrophota bacterium]
MKENKETQNKEMLLGIGWYRANQWDSLRKASTDAKYLAAKHADWLAGANADIARYKKMGMSIQKLNISIPELIKWCEEKKVPVNKDSRSRFVRDKLANSPEGKNKDIIGLD